MSEHREGDHHVTVWVSTKLLAEFEEWSVPVRAQIRETPGSGTGYEMVFRTHTCPDRGDS